MKRKKSLGYTILLIVAFIVLAIIFVKNNQMQVISPTKQDQASKVIGGDQDGHGCLIGAGYLWCPSNKKCQRLWEEECPPDFKKTVRFIKSKNSNLIIYEEIGMPALTMNYVFDGNCKVNDVFCNNLNIDNGTKAEIVGITLDNAILITNLKF